MQSLISFNLGDHKKSISILRQGINTLLDKENKGISHWEAVSALMNNLFSIYYQLHDKASIEETLIKYEHILERSQQEIPPHLFRKNKFEIFSQKIKLYLVNGRFEEGKQLVAREYSKAFLDRIPVEKVITMNINIGQLEFGLKNYDAALDYFNESLVAIKQFKAVIYHVLNRLMVILCHIEKKNFSLALSNIDALRKYISYNKADLVWENKYLLILRRVILNRGSGKDSSILETFFAEYAADDSVNKTMLFLWIQSKVEGKSVHEIARQNVA